MTDWFERLTGFREADATDPRSRLRLDGTRLHSLANRSSHEAGTLDIPSLASLRQRAATLPASGRLRARIVTADVGDLLASPEYAGALFQVASQFNLLEMIGPHVTPEHGVTRYEDDRTQGPACAIAAGAATIYRNYFVPLDGQTGQSAARQIDTLADLGAALATALGLPRDRLWDMRNGYAMPSPAGLDAIARHLAALPPDGLDALRGHLRIGLHHDVEITSAPGGRLVSQAFCSALPIAYSALRDGDDWQHFAQLVLDAAYEATLWAGVLNARRGGSDIVCLTLLGGGAFGNDPAWINHAIRRALRLAAPHALDVRLVCYHAPNRETRAMIAEFSQDTPRGA